MTRYFAYGSNMSRADMAVRCPGVRAVGIARLDDYRFFIGADGWASVRPSRGDCVHGVLWRLTPREVAALNAYEALDAGLYEVRHLPVRAGARRETAMTYLLRRRLPGKPRPGYIALIAAAARDWRLPRDYVRSLERWSAARAADERKIA
jgi:hypothetical protein